MKLNKNAKIIICGCASQNNPLQFEDKQGVTYISGVAGKSKIPELLLEKGVFVSDIPRQYENEIIPTVQRTRAYVKIQDGCNNFCSYCLIPYLRGRSRSRDIKSIVAECEVLQGTIKEIVLTGIDMSSYGLDIGSSLVELLKALRHINVRIRFGSLEANIISEQLLLATKDLQAFCPHFHLSLQSGDDQTLKAMNRKYTTDFYYSRVQMIRQFYQDAGITTDLICGFPTETEEQFANTLQFIDKIAFSDMHIFAYSKREGTVAAKYKPLDGEILKDRTKRAESVALKHKIEFEKHFIGKQLEVLLEDDGGYSREYLRVDCAGNEGDLLVVTPTEFDENKLVLKA